MSSRAYCVAAAVAFLIAGSGMASAEVEDIPPVAASPEDIAQDSGLFRKADAFGIEGATPLRRPWGGTFTSLSVGGKTVSSPIDVGPPLDGQDELHADYSSSTLDGLFPTTAMDFGPANSLVLNDPVLFGDSAGGSDFFGGPFGSWSLVPSDFDAPVKDDPTPRSGSGSCSSSDGSTSGVIRCETEEALGPFMTTSAGSDGDNQSAQQGSLFPGPSAPFGGAYLPPSAPFGGAYLPQQILSVEMIAGRNNFTTTSAGNATQGTLPPPVDVAPAPYDFVNTDGITPNSDPTAPLLSITLGGLVMTQPATSVPEIPPTAMMLIGFAGLAFAGYRARRTAVAVSAYPFAPLSLASAGCLVADAVGRYAGNRKKDRGPAEGRSRTRGGVAPSNAVDRGSTGGSSSAVPPLSPEGRTPFPPPPNWRPCGFRHNRPPIPI
jgi:hypothetical protein